MKKPCHKPAFQFFLLMLFCSVFAAPAFTQENTTMQGQEQEGPGKTGEPATVKENLIVSGNIGAGINAPKQRIDAEGYVRGSEGLCIGEACKESWPKLKCADYADRPAGESGDDFCNSQDKACFSVLLGSGVSFANECSVTPAQKHSTRCCWVE